MKLTLGQVFNSGSGRIHVMNLFCFETKRPDLKLKTQRKQLKGYLHWMSHSLTWTVHLQEQALPSSDDWLQLLGGSMAHDSDLRVLIIIYIIGNNSTTNVAG